MPGPPLDPEAAASHQNPATPGFPAAQEPNAPGGSPDAGPTRPELDGVDRLLLETALSADGPGPVVVLDDPTGALTSALVAGLTARLGAGAPDVRVHCDSWAAAQAVVAATRGQPVRSIEELGPELLTGVRLVLLRLPKSLAALDETAEAVARWADPEVSLIAGGRVRHMTRSMNDTLAEHFALVRASLGAYKSRLLIAERPRPLAPSAPPRYPVRAEHPDLGLTVCAHGAAFAGSSIDLGTRFLTTFLDNVPGDAKVAVDLGCGTGVLAVLLAQRCPDAAVWAVDDSRSAVLSATATAAANGVAGHVRTWWADSLDAVRDHPVDVIACNPPFHRGTAKDSAAAFAMFAEAGRTLRPGGELWTVYNSHLPYLSALRRLVGRTAIVGQNRGYTVTRSRRPAPSAAATA